jgi:hypothetical protein
MPYESSAPKVSDKNVHELVSLAPYKVKNRFNIEGQHIQRCQCDKKKEGRHINLHFFSAAF